VDIKCLIQSISRRPRQDFSGKKCWETSKKILGRKSLAVTPLAAEPFMSGHRWRAFLVMIQLHFKGRRASLNQATSLIAALLPDWENPVGPRSTGKPFAGNHTGVSPPCIDEDVAGLGVFITLDDLLLGHFLEATLSLDALEIFDPGLLNQPKGNSAFGRSGGEWWGRLGIDFTGASATGGTGAPSLIVIRYSP
jgi:hypothetical protein